jgi:glucosamine--fructose-6-phosphate aminotransferase (isomerizing)
MCGIIGYIGKKEALPILIEGLRRLEYRGYDSAGLVVFNQEINCIKVAGRISDLEKKIGAEKVEGTLGLAHTRWATHGAPNEINAHPHSDCSGRVWLVHNGIIENYRQLKDGLIKKGHKFASETDSEVIAHLVEEEEKSEKSFIEAVRRALLKISGTYGLLLIDKDEPGKIIAARLSSPLLLGIGKNEYYLASDAAALLPYTREVIYLDDGEMAIINNQDFRVLTLKKEESKKEVSLIDWEIEQVEKTGFSHFMLKEIFEQPEAIRNAIRGRLIKDEGLAKLGGLEQVKDKLKEVKRIIIISCGTSYYAGLLGEYMLEEYATIPVEVEYASEFRYRKPIIDKGTAVIVISQSGETADSLAALREAKMKGALTLGIVNVVGSSIARETEAGVYNHAGPEIGVASTKSFTSQLIILALLTLFLGRARQMSLVTGKRIAEEISALPEKIQFILDQTDKIKTIAKKYQDFKNFLYLGRKYNFPIALEGALKLKEISYLHAEGYAAGEMKHGPIALIDQNFATVLLAPQDSVYEKALSNLEEIKARGGQIVAVTTFGNQEIEKYTQDVIYIPKTLEMLTPVLSVVPLQLLAYYIAVLRGCDVDKPRNLAKSVTVE